MASSRKLYHDRDWLVSRYNGDDMSQLQIADSVGVSQAVVSKWMIKHGIHARNEVECHTGSRNGAWINDAPFKDREVFFEDYVSNSLSLRGMAAKYGVSLRTIVRWRNAHGISVPQGRELLNRAKGKANGLYKHGRGDKPKDCEACSKPILAKSTLCMACYGKVRRGRKNPNYKGIADIAALVRGWCNTHWRPRVYERDGYACRMCGDDTGGNLNAHHCKSFASIVTQILSDSERDLAIAEERMDAVDAIVTDSRMRSINNGITLCERCHSRIHKGLPVMNATPPKKSAVYIYHGIVERVIDGDSVIITLDLGLDVWLRNQYCRLSNINAPEKHTHTREAGEASANRLRELLETDAQFLLVKTSYDKKGSFRRLLVELWADGINVNQRLVEEGYAVIME